MPDQTPLPESPYELSRLIANLVTWGTVAAVRAKPLAVRMQCGDNTTDWLKPLMLGAGQEFSAYRLPEVGEQGVTLCAGGDLGQGVALLGLYSDAMGQPSGGPPHIKLNKANTHHARYEGEVLTLRIGNASIAIADGGISLRVGAAIFSMGDDGIATNVDIVAKGISHVLHVHGGVTRGLLETDGPQ